MLEWYFILLVFELVIEEEKYLGEKEIFVIIVFVISNIIKMVKIGKFFVIIGFKVND